MLLKRKMRITYFAVSLIEHQERMRRRRKIWITQCKRSAVRGKITPPRPKNSEGVQHFVILAILLFFSSFAGAQTVIQGSVKDAQENKGIENVNVMVQEVNNSAILGFTLTDKEGKYKIEYKGQKDSLILSTSGFNIQKQSKTVTSRNQTVDFVVNFESISLKEVRITPPKIKQIGDTIEYNVGSFTDNNDRTIGDVLKKLPGVEVEESGRILYQNLPINKFYIEGLDLLQGRYGLATKNIEAKDVQSVQVLENHQEIKMLRDKIFSEQAALNLKLKESAKGVITANALLGAGLSPLLWSGEITSMYFGKGRQNISTYKGNNAGNEVSSEQRMFYTLGSFQQQDAGLLSVLSPSTPSAISSKRHLFNQSNAVSFNNLFKPASDYQINANLNYYNDKIDKSSFSSTEYFLLRSEFLKIEETLTSRSYVNRANADVQLNGNKDNIYINNSLKLEGNWDSEQGDAITQEIVNQQLKKPSYGINNTLELIKNYGKNTLKINSYNGYSSMPHELIVKPVLYGYLLDSYDEYQAMRQKATTNRFSSNTSVSGGITKGNLTRDYSVAFRADLRHLDSELSLEQPFDKTFSFVKTPADSLCNDLQWNKLEWIFTPRYTYNYNRWKFDLILPLNYTNLLINDRLNKSEESNKRFLLNPSLRIQYKMSAYWDFYSSASLSNALGGINNEYTGYIMRNYRSLNNNEGDLYETRTQNYSLSANYRNPIRSLFGNASISYFNTKANLLYGYAFHGILQVRQSFAIPNHTDGITANIGVNKTIDAIASTVRLSGRYTNMNTSQIFRGAIIESNLQNYSIIPEISTKIQSWASFTYRFNYSESKNKLSNEIEVSKPIHTISQNVQLNFFPAKNLTINTGYEYFRNSAVVSGSRTMSFGDIGAKYKWNNTEFLLDYTNIFNAKQYISASFSDISSYYYAYDLRPAEVLLRVRFKLK